MIKDISIKTMKYPYKSWYIFISCLFVGWPGIGLKAADGFAACRFVPERMDDFAFENDKVAFRIYGPA